MRKYIFVLCLLLFFPLLFVGNASAYELPRRKIITFDQNLSVKERKQLISEAGGEILQKLSLIEGFSANMTDRAEERLKNLRGVLRIEDDAEAFALDVVRPQAPVYSRAVKKTQPAQTLPWGVDKIDAELAWTKSQGDGVRVAVIDTGIDQDHQDLDGNIAGGVNFVRVFGRVRSDQWNDDNGHGTHVAGTIAAENNAVGVVGVAPKARLYGLKVLDRNGYGWVSDIIAALDWAKGNGMQVVNMSLGTTANVTALHEAVARVYSAGIVVVAAAGNSGGSVIYPAAYDEVIAVSATDSFDLIASWSSLGPQVELCAPGVSVNSTWNDGYYKVGSGTSMATPHVSGTAALMLGKQIPEIYDADSDLTWDVSEVRHVLALTADDLGDSGRDNLYGFGLVDAEEATP